jgi:hypothetical protein
LRDKFVNDEGKEEIKVDWSKRNVREMSVILVDKMKEKLKDERPVDWMLPSFSTTTADDDKIVFSVIAMGSMQAYFDLLSSWDVLYQKSPCLELSMIGSPLELELISWQNLR